MLITFLISHLIHEIVKNRTRKMQMAKITSWDEEEKVLILPFANGFSAIASPQAWATSFQ